MKSSSPVSTLSVGETIGKNETFSQSSPGMTLTIQLVWSGHQGTVPRPALPHGAQCMSLPLPTVSSLSPCNKYQPTPLLSLPDIAHERLLGDKFAYFPGSQGPTSVPCAAGVVGVPWALGLPFSQRPRDA